MSGESRVMVQCTVCHIRYDVSARSHRDIKAGRVEPRCVLHRRRGARPRTIEAEYRRYWLDRFSMEEICEMAAAMWPRPSQRAAGVLTAGVTGPTGPA